ncbi:hypothetical protein ACFQFC_27540 [Amorphoplanes digitatis]|uniref:Glycosyltransferase n=1 Tax=Actinoplanes digitatis TaxID=1868 RepID=A0A7W7HSD5_9ACTN|nr:hypothetical protein [Actinoplanes digitatis]MBB4759898.1 hypothetical protein [Actinoplanes digitatis]
MVERGMTAALQLPAVRAVGHRYSHGHLLAHPTQVTPGDVPAIVVPTVRNPATMRDSMLLARELQRPMIALCSRWSSAEVVRKQAQLLDAPVVAVDVTDQAKLPNFSCDTLLAAEKKLNRANDVSIKRNLGLSVARMLRWQRIAFLDDDLTGLRPEAIRAAGGLLSDYNVSAMRNVGFPDNSVVCHARREVGLPQDVFVGGGAMAVRVNARTPFFPTVYNEDWLFLVGRRNVEQVAVHGRVTQEPYDPYLSPERARSEEFGDCLAEGLFSLSEHERPMQAADERFWRAFLDNRVAMIDEILARLDRSRPDERRTRIIQALKVARGRCQIIDPAFCVRYLTAWQADLDVWKRFQAGLPRHADPVAAFAALGLKAYVHLPAT